MKFATFFKIELHWVRLGKAFSNDLEEFEMQKISSSFGSIMEGPQYPQQDTIISGQL